MLQDEPGDDGGRGAGQTGLGLAVQRLLEVDAPVAVDEAMTLSRMLSTDESPRYLGGLLGRIGDLADTLR